MARFQAVPISATHRVALASGAAIATPLEGGGVSRTGSMFFFLLCGVSNTERKHIVCDCVHSPILFLIGLKAGRDTVTRTYTHPTHTRRRIDISTAVLLFLFLRLRTPHFFFFVLYFEILVMIFLRSCLWPYIASLRLRRGV